MTDPFQSSYRRISRATKHMHELDKKIHKFFKKKPYEEVIEDDKSGKTKLYKIKLTKQIPSGFTDLAVEAIEGLRSALDHATYATAILSGKSDPRHTYFPISESETELDNVIKGRCKDVPLDIITVCRSFKPYKGGNTAVFVLNQLCNINKHRLIHPIGMAHAETKIQQMHITTGDFAFFINDWNREKNELLFARTAPNSKLQYCIKFSFSIVFGAPDAMGDQPVIPVLRRIADEVKLIVTTIESVAKQNRMIS